MTPAEREELAGINEVFAKMRAVAADLLFLDEDDHGAALRRVMGDAPQGRA